MTHRTESTIQPFQPMAGMSEAKTGCAACTWEWKWAWGQFEPLRCFWTSAFFASKKTKRHVHKLKGFDDDLKNPTISLAHNWRIQSPKSAQSLPVPFKTPTNHQSKPPSMGYLMHCSNKTGSQDSSSVQVTRSRQHKLTHHEGMSYADVALELQQRWLGLSETLCRHGRQGWAKHNHG